MRTRVDGYHIWIGIKALGKSLQGGQRQGHTNGKSTGHGMAGSSGMRAFEGRL